VQLRSKPMSSNIKKTGVNLPEDLHEEVKIAATKRKKSIQGAIIEGLREWLKGGPSAAEEAASTAKLNELHRSSAEHYETAFTGLSEIVRLLQAVADRIQMSPCPECNAALLVPAAIAFDRLWAEGETSARDLATRRDAVNEALVRALNQGDFQAAHAIAFPSAPPQINPVPISEQTLTCSACESILSVGPGGNVKTLELGSVLKTEKDSTEFKSGEDNTDLPKEDREILEKVRWLMENKESDKLPVIRIMLQNFKLPPEKPHEQSEEEGPSPRRKHSGRS
jgi:hypothetical protein